MKTVRTIASKVMIVTVTMFFLGLSVIGSGSAKADVTADGTIISCGVSDADVVKYLSSYGYQVYELRPIDGCCDKVARTQYPYTTTVFITDGIITGHEDDNR